MTIDRPRFSGLAGMTGLLIIGFLAVATAQAATTVSVTVDVGANGAPGAAVTGFKYLLQEDATSGVEPGVSVPNADDPNLPLSMTFHTSYHPIAQVNGQGISGHADGNTVQIAAVPDGRYYLSILPYEGFAIGGTPVIIENGEVLENGIPSPSGVVTVKVQQHPIPTTQIAIYLFHDNAPVNAAPDLPEELNPAVGEPGHVDWTQFSLFLEEPAGRYGAAGGQVIQDAFGNPLGTTYLPNGNVDVLGDGTIHPNPDGTILVKHLAPAKYGIIMIPPTGSNWQQSSTIEGSKVIDAWVKANEPPFFVEFGPPGPHVFIGFVKSSSDWVQGEAGGFPPLQPPAVGEDVATVSGTITDMHMSRSPTTTFFSGRPFPGCWVALNDMTVGIGRGVYAEPCDADSNFSIANVPPGDYQLKVFDANLDVVMATQGFTVNPSGGHCNGFELDGTTPVTPNCDFGEVGVFNWFSRLDAGIFNDKNQNGFWEPDGADGIPGNADDENGIGPESQDVGLRWRDGTLYQNFPTDGDGFAPFDEMFPFFHWLVAEASFGTKKATGATFVVDNGGEVRPHNGWTDPTFDTLTPQPQCRDDGTGSGATVGFDPATGECPAGFEEINPNTQNNLSRTEQGVVLTAGVQGFLGQTSVMHFGKTDYISFTPADYSDPNNPILPQFVGENGGISGLVYYSTTRAENEPQFAAAEEWEPGIPRVQLALYADGDIDSFPLGDWPNGVGDVDWNGNVDAGGNLIRDLDDDVIDDLNGDGVVTLADVDNAPLGWADGTGIRGPEDIDRDDPDRLLDDAVAEFDLGDALQVTWTDSWDDNLPTGCQGETYEFVSKDGDPNTVDPSFPTDCFDGLRNFNQVRPAVFDGGYAFVDYDKDHIGLVNPAAVAGLNAYVAAAEARVAAVDPALVDTLQLGLIPGDYIVEASAPPGYEHIKEQDKNVDFGDEYDPTTQALAAACVGEEHLVPPYLSMQTVPDETLGRRPVVDPANLIDAPFAGLMRPMCDLKKVPLSSAQNAAAEFFMMTDVPVAANVSGVILNDLANEFDPNSPNFGEKYAPPWVPVAFYDWNGELLNRVYADQFGRYNAILPSTSTANLPIPSGMSPNMVISCMNDAGPIPDGAGNLVKDPYFDSQYSQFCYTFQYMPGVITYLDTPVEPIAAFAGPGRFPVDCERPTSTPIISSVTRSTNDGPYVLAGERIIITSMGLQEVPDPEWDGINFGGRLMERNYSFDAGAAAELRDADGNFVSSLSLVGAATPSTITADVPGTVLPGDYQVVVTNGDGAESPIGVTLTVDDVNDPVNVIRIAEGDSIQAAIDAAAPNDLILVGPGDYDELVIMWKPVKLQGWGAGVTVINARQSPTEKVANWRQKTTDLVAGQAITPLDGQVIANNQFAALAENLFPTEEGAGIFVAGLRGNRQNTFGKNNSRIDGFTILGASTGGGIVVNGYATGLSIGNNRLNANAGVYGGGIRIGHPSVIVERANGNLEHEDAENDNIRIHHNHIAQNGGRMGAGGGVSLYTGADNYAVENNWVCGNFTQGDGAGIGHLGLSDNGLIADNDVIFNESFSQMSAQSGGGIFIGGKPPLLLDGAQLSSGAGSARIESNRIRGNLAGAGDGGGIRIASVNGEDVAANTNGRNASRNWFGVEIFNNMITNNVAAMAGGGISIQDSLKVDIRSNTVANNDSTATASVAFVPGQFNVSRPQPAGIVSHLHSDDFGSLMVNDVSNNAIPDGADPVRWRAFSDPVIRDDIVLHNRSFYWINFDDPTTPGIETGLFPATCADPVNNAGDVECDPATANLAGAFSSDLAIMVGAVPAPGVKLDPQFSMLTDPAPYDPPIPSVNTNVEGSDGNLDFANGYFNVGRDSTLLFNEATTLQTAGAFDEGGNFLQVSYGPLSLLEPGAGPDGPESNTTEFDYHLCAGAACTSAKDSAEPVLRAAPLHEDIDNDPRSDIADIGADEATN